VDGAEGAVAPGVGLHQGDRAGPAVALGAALLAAGEAGGAEVVEQRAVGGLALDRHRLAVERELEAVVHGPGAGQRTTTLRGSPNGQTPPRQSFGGFFPAFLQAVRFLRSQALP